jgi:metal-responsive CopG/Arc/MetJ family transcriptional regulator
VAVRQISIILDEELLQFLDQSGGNRSAAITEAVREFAAAVHGDTGMTPP